MGERRTEDGPVLRGRRKSSMGELDGRTNVGGLLSLMRKDTCPVGMATEAGSTRAVDDERNGQSRRNLKTRMRTVNVLCNLKRL